MAYKTAKIDLLLNNEAGHPLRMTFGTGDVPADLSKIGEYLGKRIQAQLDEVFHPLTSQIAAEKSKSAMLAAELDAFKAAAQKASEKPAEPQVTAEDVTEDLSPDAKKTTRRSTKAK